MKQRTRVHYKSGQRTFITDESKNINNYFKVQDKDTKVIFKLPISVIKSKQYIFSWDRYAEERNNSDLRITLETELNRLKEKSIKFRSFNIQKGIQDIERFLKELDLIIINIKKE